MPLLILSYPLDIIFSNLLKESHNFQGEYEVWNDIYNTKINCDIAVYGSSRAWVQIDPEIIEDILDKEVYNFGIDGHNFRIQYLRHLEFLKLNKKPKHILLSVDVFTLEKRKDLYQKEQFLPYMLWDKNIRTFTSNYQGFSTADYYIPFLRYVGNNKVFKEVKTMMLKKDTALYRNKGYRGIDKKWELSVDSILAGEQKYKIKFHKETISLFEQFIMECLKNNITLTLVYAPEFIKGQNFVSNREEAMEYYRNISKKYELNFLDYSQDDLSFRKNLFYNTSHLNRVGAQLFSRKLAQDFKKIQNQINK